MNNRALISHRGNINGKNIDKENSPIYICDAINCGYDVEIDVWLIDNKFYLGHDEPTHLVDMDFLVNQKLWCHAKNINALEKMIMNKTIKCFFHIIDDYTLTSNGFIWTYPGKTLTSMSIAVLPEIYNYNKIELDNCYGICSDFIDKYK